MVPSARTGIQFARGGATDVTASMIQQIEDLDAAGQA